MVQYSTVQILTNIIGQVENKNYGDLLLTLSAQNNQYRAVLWEFLRLYTSSVFDIINPRDRIRMIKKYSDFVMDKDISLLLFLWNLNDIISHKCIFIFRYL